MFAKEFTHKSGLYTAMHNVKYVYINKKGAFSQGKRTL